MGIVAERNMYIFDSLATRALEQKLELHKEVVAFIVIDREEGEGFTFYLVVTKKEYNRKKRTNYFSAIFDAFHAKGSIITIGGLKKIASSMDEENKDFTNAKIIFTKDQEVIDLIRKFK